ncbi:MAG TPA: thiamine pyrophosphate-binding protein [Pseudonocardiaceae bacterium]|nr:thiamine pyrophosphate-binding protein [Pseudonocardiaceae bacterium]
MAEITGHRYLARALAAAGVTHVFMVPTIVVPALAEMDALGIVGIMAHGEKAAAYMADGYARLGRRPGFTFAQTVGAANLAAGLRDGYLARSPVIAMTGGTTPMSRGRGVYQEIEDFPLYHQVTKYNAQLEDVHRLPDLLRQCFRAATTGAPGPVHLDLRGSIGNVLLDSLDPDGYGPPVEPTFLAAPALRPRPDADAVGRIAALIGQADRPVLVLGGGARMSGAGAAALAVACRGQVPIATSLNAKGICDETDPLVVGVVGASSRKPANQTLERADLVVFVGSATGTQVTDTWRLPKPGTTVVQIDIDPEQLGRNYPTTVAVQADARVALEELAEVIEPGDHGPWLRETAEYVTSWRADAEAALASGDSPIRPERLCRELTDFLPDDGVLVVDTGHAGIWTADLIDLRPGQDLLRAAGSLGWSFPAAIGAQCAAPDRTVVCFTGDGGFYYHLAEVETAVRHGIAPIIVVNDNVSLSQDAKVFRSAWGGKDSVSERGELMWRFTDVDLASVAASLGAFSVRVEKPADLAPALAEARAAGRIAIVDVVTNAEVFPPVPHGGRDFYSAAGQS